MAHLFGLAFLFGWLAASPQQSEGGGWIDPNGSAGEGDGLEGESGSDKGAWMDPNG